MRGLFTHSDDEKAVEELLSQAMDMVILEQVASINCAAFSDSHLPSNLETRFQTLKTFPSKTSSLSTQNLNNRKMGELINKKGTNKLKKLQPYKERSPCSKKSPESKTCLSHSHSKPSDHSGSFSHSNKKVPPGRLAQKQTKTASASPLPKSSYFLCCANKVSRKKNDEKRDLHFGFDWGKHNGFLSKWSNTTVKRRQMMVKKAMKQEEEKICREAEKIVRWVNHATSRMDVYY